MPEIPKTFFDHAKIRFVLHHTINGFDFEEKIAVYYYCFLNLPISEIAAVTELSENHVASVLGLYSERLKYKIGVFKKAVPYNANDLLPVSELLFLDLTET